MIKNIKVGVVVIGPQEVKKSIIGERIEDYEKYFHELFFDHIQDDIKHSNWGLWFKQDDEFIPNFVVDIYVNNQNDYLLIKNVIDCYKQPDPKLTIMAPYYTFQNFIEKTT